MEYTYEKTHPGIRWQPENQSSLQGQLLPVAPKWLLQVSGTTEADGEEGHADKGLVHSGFNIE